MAIAKETFREQRVTVPANQIYALTFIDTMPNFATIVNSDNVTVYVSSSGNVSAQIYDIIIPPYGTRVFAKPLSFNTIFFYSTGSARLYVASAEADFDPSMISQTQEISSTPQAGLLGIVTVDSILDPLPTGNNNIGIVDVNSLPSLSPGANLIGSVNVNQLPAIPTGSNIIGIVQTDSGTVTWTDQTTTDAYADLGLPWQKNRLKSATLVIKNTGATNGALVKVLGSVDGTNFDVELQAEATIAASSLLVVTVSTYVTRLKIQIKAAVAGSQTTVSASGAGIAV